MTYLKQSRGFTLIELLVVIAIIGLLSSVVLAAVNSARVKARDAERLSEMRQLQNALALYYSDNGHFPPTSTNSRVSELDAVDNSGLGNITPYINPIPADPTYTTSNGYRYRAGVNNASYSLLVHLERNAPNWCSISNDPGYTGWNFSNGTNYPLCYQ